MQKAKVTTSEAMPGKFRLILNVNDSYSVGSVMTKGELRALMNEIRVALEGAQEEEAPEAE